MAFGQATCRKIRLIEGNAKWHHLKNWFVKDFCLGWSSNFVSFNSGQIQREKTPGRIWCHTDFHIQYSIHIHIGKGAGRVEPERRGEGQQWRVQITSRLENTNTTEQKQEIGYLQSKNSDKHLPQSPLTGKFFLYDAFCIDFYMSLIFLRSFCTVPYIHLPKFCLPHKLKSAWRKRGFFQMGLCMPKHFCIFSY